MSKTADRKAAKAAAKTAARIERYTMVGAVVTVETIDGMKTGSVIDRDGGWITASFDGERHAKTFTIDMVRDVLSAAPGFTERFAQDC